MKNRNLMGGMVGGAMMMAISRLTVGKPLFYSNMEMSSPSILYPLVTIMLIILLFSVLFTIGGLIFLYVFSERIIVYIHGDFDEEMNMNVREMCTEELFILGQVLVFMLVGSWSIGFVDFIVP